MKKKRKRKIALVFKSRCEDRNREYALSIYLIGRRSQSISKEIEIENSELRCHRIWKGCAGGNYMIFLWKMKG